MAEVIRTEIGRVISDKNTATRTVEVKWARQHETYGKVVRRTTKYYIHDPNHESKLGDLVSFKQIRPISKTKKWQLVEVLERNED